MTLSYKKMTEFLQKDSQHNDAAPELPSWQSRLIDQIVFCMEQNYISHDEISSDMTFREKLVECFANEFAHLESEETIVDEYKKEKGFINPDVYLTSFNADGRDHDTRLKILKQEISARGITCNAIILNGEGAERSIYLVKNGEIIEDNLFKGMPLTHLTLPNNVPGNERKIERSSLEAESLIDEALEKTAYTQFSEKKVNQILEDITGDLHLSFCYYPDTISQNSEYVKKEMDFPPSPQPDASRDQYGFYEDPGNENLDIPSNVGYMRLSRIYDPTKDDGVQRECFRVMQGMQEKEAVIIDVRYTGGGTPEGVQNIVSYFFKSPTHLNTVHMKDGDKEFHTRDLNTLNPDKNSNDVVDLSDKTVYVLVGQGTFSAAEELAYDLQQLGRAEIIGSRTRGGAHPCEMKPLISSHSTEDVDYNDKFCLIVPNATSINPHSKTNWEDGPKQMNEEPGVQPDTLILENEDALEKTLQDISGGVTHYKTPTPFD